jgi:TetR/AcrR family fatty acid metabolism transcriptional regulator
MGEKQDPIQAMLVKARRAQILDAATKVFAEKGFHRATIKEIARVAGVADGTIYTYFENKTAVLVGLLNRLNETEQREMQFEQGTTQDIRSFFVAYARQRLEIFWPNREVMQAILPELLVNAELREIYYRQIIEPTTLIGERYFQAQIEQGQIRAVDIPLAVRTVASTFLGLLVMSLLGDTQVATRWEELPEVLATMLFDGLHMPTDA